MKRENRSTTAKALIRGSKYHSCNTNLCNGWCTHYAWLNSNISDYYALQHIPQCTSLKHWNVIFIRLEYRRNRHHLCVESSLCLTIGNNPTFPVWFVKLCPRDTMAPSFTNTQPIGTSRSRNAIIAYSERRNEVSPHRRLYPYIWYRHINHSWRLSKIALQRLLLVDRNGTVLKWTQFMRYLISRWIYCYSTIGQGIYFLERPK